MAVAPRSFVIGAHTSAAGVAFNLLTVPPGMTVIAKTAIVNNKSGVESQVLVYVARPAPFIQMDIVNAMVPAQLAPVIFDSWMVCEAGDVIGVYATEANVNFWVSGSLLQGEAALPPFAATQPVPPVEITPPPPPT